MKEVLSVFTFGIGALCFVVFVIVFQSGMSAAGHETDQSARSDDVRSSG
jgi:hypothetical protein